MSFKLACLLFQVVVKHETLKKADRPYGEWRGDKELSCRRLGWPHFSTSEPVGLFHKSCPNYNWYIIMNAWSMSLICNVYSLLVSTSIHQPSVLLLISFAPSCKRFQPCKDQTEYAHTQPPTGCLFGTLTRRGSSQGYNRNGLYACLPKTRKSKWDCNSGQQVENLDSTRWLCVF